MNSKLASIFAAVLLALTVHAQDPLTNLPDNYHLVFENRYVQVIHVRYLPHQKLPVHDHPATPAIYIYLTDSGPVRFSHIEQHAFSVTRAPLKAGMFRLSPGRLEKHEVENLGDIPTEFLRVELKQVPLGFQRRDFRDTKPVDLTHSSTSIEFPGPFVRIERIIVAAAQTAEIDKSNQPSLLVSILPAGEVHWINPHGAYTTGSHHMLRISFLVGT